MVGVVVARALGPEALGRFALLFTILLALVSVQSAWVGDSLTVLDRTQTRLRRGISNTQWVQVVLGSIAGGILAYAIGHAGLAASFVFAGLVAAWELEEFGRRVFIARLEFWRQAANDGSYLVFTAAALAVCAILSTLSLALVLACMTIGAMCAFLLGIVWLPDNERLQRPTLSTSGLRDVAGYGIWRGAQSGAGYAAQVIVRGLVIGLASVAIMGQLEASRLVFAPLFVLVAAVANLTLATFARSARETGGGTSKLVRAAVVGSAAICVLYGAVVLVFPNVFVRLLAGAQFDPDRLALAGWFALAIAIAITTPFSTLALVISRSSTVFYLRVAGSVFGLLLTIVALEAARPELVPAALAAGALLSGVLLWRLTRKASGLALAGARNTLVPALSPDSPQ